MNNLSILTVCSGNICRSPLAEGILREGLRSIDGIGVSSAGVIAGDGDLATDLTVRIAADYGIDLSRHRARYLLEPQVASADLLFAMSKSHRRAIVELVPRKVLSTFTLREFARLSHAVPEARLVRSAAAETSTRDKLLAVIREVAAMRGQTEPLARPEDDDIIDPYRRDEETYRLSAAELVPAAEQVVRVLILAARS